MRARPLDRTSRRAVVAVLSAIAIVPASATAQETPPGPEPLAYDTFVQSTVIAVPPGGAQSGIATCPAGSRVVGGGVTTNSATPNNAVPWRIMLSGPLDETGSMANTADGDIARSWYAYVVGGGLFRISALCSRASDAFVETTDFQVQDNSTGNQGSAVATCPAGSRAIGGGVGSTGPAPAGDGFPLYRVMLSGPLDETGLTANTDDNDVARSWFGFVNNNSLAQRLFKVMALCSRTADATVAATSLTLGSDGAQAGAVTCPAGARILGGGVGTTGPTTGIASYQVMLSGPLDETGESARTANGDVARQWSAYVHNNTAAPELFKFFALCTGERTGGGGGGGSGGGGSTGSGTTGGGSGKPLRCGGKRATIVGTSGRDTLRGTRRSDVIVALGGNDRVLAGRGNDRVCAGGGKDRVAGDSGSDRLVGESDQDTLKGGSGNDLLDGGRAADLLLAGSGNDRLLGGTGNDLLEGDSGRDRLAGQSGRDTCVGGSGKDKAKCERRRKS